MQRRKQPWPAVEFGGDDFSEFGIVQRRKRHLACSLALGTSYLPSPKEKGDRAAVEEVSGTS